MRIDQSSSSLGDLLAHLGQGKGRSSATDASVDKFKETLASSADQAATPEASADTVEYGMTPFLAVALAARQEASNSQASSQVSDATAATTTTAAASTNPSASETSSAITYALDTTEYDPSPAAPWNMTLVKPSIASSLGPDTRSALDTALQKAGIDPSNVKVSYWEEIVFYPAGSYINKSITVQTPNGQKMDFDAAATLRTPDVTANSVQDMMRMTTASTAPLELS